MAAPIYRSLPSKNDITKSDFSCTFFISICVRITRCSESKRAPLDKCSFIFGKYVSKTVLLKICNQLSHRIPAIWNVWILAVPATILRGSGHALLDVDQGAECKERNSRLTIRSSRPRIVAAATCIRYASTRPLPRYGAA